MKTITFNTEKACPLCGGAIKTGEILPEYDPIRVFKCPHCGEQLWRPGLEEQGPLFAFSADAEEDSI